MIESPIKKLQMLYDLEMNWSIECFYDNGFRVRLGDNLNGYSYDYTFDSLEQAIDILFKTGIGELIKDND